MATASVSSECLMLTQAYAYADFASGDALGYVEDVAVGQLKDMSHACGYVYPSIAVDCNVGKSRFRHCGGSVSVTKLGYLICNAGVSFGFTPCRRGLSGYRAMLPPRGVGDGSMPIIRVISFPSGFAWSQHAGLVSARNGGFHSFG